MPGSLPKSLERPLGRAMTLALIALLAAVLRTMMGPGLDALATATMLLGFLLLAAFVAGELVREARLPRITGYLVIGMVLGPHVLDLLPESTVEGFGIINGVALSVIALQAGGELRLRRLKARLRAIGAITISQLILLSIGMSLVVYLGRDLLPFLEGRDTNAVLAVALVLAVVAVATSPAATMAVLGELRARGAVSQTVLGVAVLKDVLVLLLIAILIPLATVLVEPGRGFDLTTLSDLSVSLLASLAAGALVGGGIAVYLARVNRQPVLFLLVVALLVVEVSVALHLEFILVSMVAGFVVQNLSAEESKFLEALEANSLPLYALFFALAGAKLQLDVLPAVWKIGLLLILFRGIFVYASTRIGAALARADDPVRRYSWLGFISQAGVTLGLAAIVSARFPEWGSELAAVIIGMVALHELVGPPLFRLGLVRAGEATREVPNRAIVPAVPASR